MVWTMRGPVATLARAYLGCSGFLPLFKKATISLYLLSIYKKQEKEIAQYLAVNNVIL